MAEPLAAITDLTDRLGPLSHEQTQRAQALLADASAMVRAYTRQTFDLVVGDEVVLRPIGTMLRLPQRPVRAVTAVVAVGGGGLSDVPLVGWVWDGLDKVNIDGLSALVLNLPEWWNDLDGGPNTYRVTYDHGYDPVPDDVVAVVCGMVGRVLTAPSMVDGMMSERIGQYSYQLQQGSGAGGSAPRLTAADKDALARYRRMATTIATSIL